jgi:hypothetical protein
LYCPFIAFFIGCADCGLFSWQQLLIWKSSLIAFLLLSLLLHF